jgi:hypothetical protein
MTGEVVRIETEGERLMLKAWRLLKEHDPHAAQAFLDWLASQRTVPPPAWVPPEARKRVPGGDA